MAKGGEDSLLAARPVGTSLDTAWPSAGPSYAGRAMLARGAGAAVYGLDAGPPHSPDCDASDEEATRTGTRVERVKILLTYQSW